MTLPDPVTPPTEPATPPEPPAPAEPAAPPEPAGTPEQTIARLEAELKAARAEAGKSRVNAKAAAADEARAELAQQIGKALGLVKDEPVDPAQLTEQLASAGAAARQAQVELAVFRASQESGADPMALLDSRTFLESVAQIDPGDGEAVAQAIAAAVASNPRLGRPEAPPAMKRNPAQGASASPPLGLAEQIAAAEKAGDVRESLRLKARQALTPQN